MNAGTCSRLLSSLAMAALLSPFVGACKSDGGGGGQGGASTGGQSTSGGNTGTGGKTASGGTTGSGGASASGGSSGSGGSSASGGTTASGGATSSGGTTASGGAAGSGGASKTGGTTSTGAGGAATGGAATGGASTSSAATGGAGGAKTGTGGTAGTKAGTGGSFVDGGATGTGGAGGGGSTGSCPTINFGTWTSGKDPLTVGKLGTSYFMKNQLQAGLDNYGGDGYAWTFGYVGSLQFTQTTADTTNGSSMIGKFDCGMTGPDNGTSASVDTRAFGDLPLEIFLEAKKDACKTLGMLRADAQWKSTTADGITTDARYWIDDMYMITSLQVWAFRATKNQQYLDRAAKAMVAYIAALQKDNDTKTTGLFWHTKNSHAYWGRANGWFASGATELLLELPAGHTNRDAIMAAYKKQMDALVGLQNTASGADQGCWRQVLDRTDAWAESSCSAMFTFALATGLKNGWLSGDKYVTAAANGWKCIANKTDSTGLLAKVCEGTGEATGTDLATQQSYYLGRGTPAGDRHGQGPLLWAANALLRSDCPGVR
jgi:unsaturated rhamnogalacturonyl hydrolase